MKLRARSAVMLAVGIAAIIVGAWCASRSNGAVRRVAGSNQLYGLPRNGSEFSGVTERSNSAWLSDHELLNLLGSNELQVLDTRTGRVSPVEAFNRAVHRAGLLSGRYWAEWISLSSDHKWVLWHQGRSNGNSVFVAARLDGSRVVTVDTTGDMNIPDGIPCSWLPDSSGWIAAAFDDSYDSWSPQHLLRFDIPAPHPIPVVRASRLGINTTSTAARAKFGGARRVVMGSSPISASTSTPAPAGSTASQSWDLPLVASPQPFMAPNGDCIVVSDNPITVTTYRLGATLTPRTSISLDSSWYRVLREPGQVALSPHGDRIAWFATYLQRLLGGWVPQTQELCITRADGSHPYCIPLGIAAHCYNDMEWMPDGKHVSMSDGTAIYIVPVP
ncbi:MAG: hypothetical protein ACLQVD_10350 [Capsulimonadaceae bacterium]